ncbi:DUF309 domain-containing protein [Thalassobacillus sp. CUG 92003]|uniref:DUF309 domain-containing protein n=1 Tax=Thalassobacillus sp. CUG 92003 TaxID=2736641 RepID=UPI0015E71E1A|nr:DUF309 domain-containing protein [Thalassobacillus sp. CUG 92003]
MYPNLYIEYLAHFHGTRDYFECHEVLEELWKEREPGVRDSVWVLLIQIAVCQYHYRRGNSKGASIMNEKALAKWPKRHEEIEKLGLDHSELYGCLQKVQTNINHDVPYQSINLPIHDPELLEKTENMCQSWGVTFGDDSDLKNDFLVHKHKRRDRTGVIAERDRKQADDQSKR